MPEARHAIAAVLVAAAVTWALRALPFAVLTPLRTSATVQYLTTRMPAGVMLILVVHCLRDLPITHARVLAPMAALAVTISLHLWRRNALLSILGGTAVHVILASTEGGAFAVELGRLEGPLGSGQLQLDGQRSAVLDCYMAVQPVASRLRTNSVQQLLIAVHLTSVEVRKRESQPPAFCAAAHSSH